MKIKRSMNHFVKWLSANEGMKSSVSAGNAREIWRLMSEMIVGEAESIKVDGLCYVSHPLLTAMWRRGLRKRTKAQRKSSSQRAHVYSPQEKENYSAEEKMRNNRLTDQAALLVIFMVVLTFGEPFAELRVVAFGLGALIWIVWRGK
jgi:hypothetical protein